MEQLLQPSKQERSRKTQARILEATARLLEAMPFERITVRTIVAEAETSIGSFYARFRDKDALLPVLFAQDEARLDRRLARLRDQVGVADSLTEIADLIADHFVHFYGDNPNLSQAVFGYIMRNDDPVESRAHSEHRLQQYDFLIEALLRFRSDFSQTDATKAVKWGLYFLTVACRNRLFFPDAPLSRTLKISKRDLKTELSRLLVGYLTT